MKQDGPGPRQGNQEAGMEVSAAGRSPGAGIGFGGIPPGGKSMYWVIDRFEGGRAVCQNDAKTMREIPRDRLPPGLKEGDVLAEDGRGYRLDEAETARRRQAVRDAAAGMWA